MMITHPLSRFTSLTLLLASGPLRPQTPGPMPFQVRPSATAAATLPVRSMGLVAPNLPRKDLLPAGVPQGTFHLTGLVRRDKSVVLRWANTHGEMPTEGVRIFRQKAGDTSWKELKDNAPVGFFQGPVAAKRLRALPEADRHAMLSLFHGTLQYDPATKRRVTQPPAVAGVRDASDLNADKVLGQFRTLRAQGRLAQSDLQLLHAQADLDPRTADIFGLSYVDKPGSGQWRYKIAVKLPNGAAAEAVCDKLFNPAEPTQVPIAVNLAAKSGNGAVLLNWEPGTTDVVAGYHVYRADSAAGPFKKLTSTPVKLVTLEVEDPELAMRKAMAKDEALEKELKRHVGESLTADRVKDIRTQAAEAAADRGPVKELSPALAGSIKDGLASGRIAAAGRHKPLSAYADDRTLAGNSDLQIDKAYVYKVTTVDIAGGETPLETAALVSGTPRDFQAPVIPGRPHLAAQAAALGHLREAQALRAKDARLSALDRSIGARTPQPERRMSATLGAGVPALPGAAAPMPAPPAETASLTLSEAKRQRASRSLALMPTQALAEVAAASVVRSNPDGSVPPAKLAWAPSGDPDLKSYEVFRADGTGPFLKLGSSATPEYTDAALEVGHAYRYAVSALDQHGNESSRSAEGTVEVCDSGLKDKLALKLPKGTVGTAAPAGVSSRTMLRPAGLAMRTAGMASLKASALTMKLPKTSASLPMTAQAVPLSASPARRGPQGPRLSAKVITETAPMAPKAAFEAPAALTAPKAATQHRRKVRFGWNPMLVEPAKPKELHVVLEWDRPLPGYPLEYVVYQAAQKISLKANPRASRKPALFRPTAAFAAAPGAPLLLVEPSLGASAKAGAAAPGGSPKPALVSPMATQAWAASPEQHLLATQGVAARQGAGLREAGDRKGQSTNLLMEAGPGEFSRISENPVQTERFAVTFPADVAQFGGASFYFRVQARTREFGRLVEGPLSEWVEVRLPDLVPPAPPLNGALDLQEADPEHFNVALSWAAVTAKDVEGYFVDRQPMAFTLVDGEPTPGAPLGDPQRLTAKANGAASYLDASTPGGYWRYTLRAVDKAGNVSDAQGALDVLVPGEPVPAAPTALALAGDTLTWKAGLQSAGFTVWRSFTGQDDDYECISGILGAGEASFALPAQGTLHLKVVARSASGMHQIPSQPLVRSK